MNDMNVIWRKMDLFEKLLKGDFEPFKKLTWKKQEKSLEISGVVLDKNKVKKTELLVLASRQLLLTSKCKKLVGVFLYQQI